MSTAYECAHPCYGISCNDYRVATLSKSSAMLEINMTFLTCLYKWKTLTVMYGCTYKRIDSNYRKYLLLTFLYSGTLKPIHWKYWIPTKNHKNDMVLTTDKTTKNKSYKIWYMEMRDMDAVLS